ncbi:MAG: aminomethyl-transferring glycine dehydrogenase [Flavobacteriia bacterium]|nr:aminomethyl-transferring glycine dehydrogenase [Flavobacteriia bacterium]
MEFIHRHIGNNESEQQQMLDKLSCNQISDLIEKTVPSDIFLKNELKINKAMTEDEYLIHIQKIASKNKVFKSMIGLGYNETIVPSVILRNVLENPGWYTAYTPYQAEISQGRLEALLNFQTMILDLTKMDIANASLLDEGTAAAEAMIMMFNSRTRQQQKENINKFFVSENIFPQNIEVLKGRAKNLKIELIIDDEQKIQLDESYFGAIIQYPDAFGKLYSPKSLIQNWKEKEIQVALIADIMALVLLKAPGEMNADVVLGSTQRFGVPMGFGGPHAAFFACKEEYKRNIPGRIIGVSKDADDQLALRMALQTREQHIKRDKATSNICTAQALLAVMASMYAVYHGPKELKNIANSIHNIAANTANVLTLLGYQLQNKDFFDTLHVIVPQGKTTSELKKISENKGYNFRYINEKEFTLSFAEGFDEKDFRTLSEIFSNFVGMEIDKLDFNFSYSIEKQFLRNDEILTHPTFNSYHTESKMMRYLKRLENKDLSLVHSMISLGSCTMKLNAASEMMPISLPAFANIHPFAPKDQVQGYIQMIEELEKDLCEITGFHSVSLQPNSGAQGEYAGLMVIKAFHESRGDFDRVHFIIPSSAHGTNPASAVMAGFEVVITPCDENGNINISELKKKAEEYSTTLAGIMITYPSTHGVYEEGIKEITSIVHQFGGQVYMDGANMNAQVGLTNPGNIGADVCHLNLHKTFAIPHGGGGPGMGPIGVAQHLSPFLPGNPFVNCGGEKPIYAVSSAPYGSASILLISYGYIKMLGANGLKKATENAILNANYLKECLKNYYPILYTGKNDTVAHELILDCREFKKTADVEVADIAKRLIDYGFHAPTVSFPVAGTLMIEPTESEDKAELDRFVLAMIQIRQEIKEIEDGIYNTTNNVLKNSPHNAQCIIKNEWNYPYSPQKAAYPVEYLTESKYWVPVRRVDNAFGDRNLICSCPSVDSYLISN